MIIAYHSVLILDKETVFNVLVGSHLLMCPERIPAVVHPNPSPPEKKRDYSYTVPH